MFGRLLRWMALGSAGGAVLLQLGGCVADLALRLIGTMLVNQLLEVLQEGSQG